MVLWFGLIWHLDHGIGLESGQIYIFKLFWYTVWLVLLSYYYFNIVLNYFDYILLYRLLGWFYFAYFIFNIILLCFHLQRCVLPPFVVSEPFFSS